MSRLRAVLAIVLVLAGCADAPEPREVVVFAATSLREPLLALAPSFERANDAKVVFVFGSSGDLAKQILAADRADAFLSADEIEMGRVEQAGRIDPASRFARYGNLLVVIEPREGNPSAFPPPFEPAQLAGERIKRLSLANVATVPAGRYAKSWLEAQHVWDRVADRVVPAVDARAALAAVESGACQAGIVYKTDASLSNRVVVVHLVPPEQGPTIEYPFAAVRDGAAPDLGAAFVQHLDNLDAWIVFRMQGFTDLSGD